MGRPSLYNPDTITAICERLGQGEPLAVICREDGMPAYRTVKDWMDERDAQGEMTERAAFVSAAIARAREEGEDSIAADCLLIADDSGGDYRLGDKGLILDSDHIQRSKLRIETRLKLLAKFNPKRWGDKVEQVLSNPDGSGVLQGVTINLVKPS
jgi:hypothetical protein